MNVKSQGTSTTCRVCGSDDVAFLCQSHNEHSKTQSLDNYRCRSCGSVFIGNPITTEELAEAYSTLDERTYYEETAIASLEKFNNAAQDIASLVPRDAEILDIGGGDGTFARALARNGFRNISLHEIPGSKIANIGDIIRKTYRDFDYSTLPATAFDVVCLMDVLEHVSNPSRTVAAVNRILRPGGFIYLHSPVVTVLNRLMHFIQRLPAVGGIGRSWQRARTSIFHLQNYTPRSLSLLMRKHGFMIKRLVCINELSWPLERYARVYFVEKAGMPKALLPAIVMLASPILRSAANRNKGVLVALKT
jgi:SAM-dependent methyltransferase